jgi:hypothetical protein
MRESIVKVSPELIERWFAVQIGAPTLLTDQVPKMGVAWHETWSYNV